jgi:hypothetical protein
LYLPEIRQPVLDLRELHPENDGEECYGRLVVTLSGGFGCWVRLGRSFDAARPLAFAPNLAARERSIVIHPPPPSQRGPSQPQRVCNPSRVAGASDESLFKFAHATRHSGRTEFAVNYSKQSFLSPVTRHCLAEEKFAIRRQIKVTLEGFVPPVSRSETPFKYYWSTSRRLVSDSMRSTRGVYPIPGAVGTRIVPCFDTSTSGSMMSSAQ